MRPGGSEQEAWELALAALRARHPKVRVQPLDAHPLFGRLDRVGIRLSGLALWNTVYLDRALHGTALGASVLRHEGVHLDDQHRFGPLFFLSYFLPPVGPSFKAFWEWRAYRQDLLEGTPPEVIAGHFASGTYAWMWPWKGQVLRWCQRALDRRREAELSTARRCGPGTS